MVMGSIFDTPTDEEDQNPPQPQQPPPQDPLAQQPTQDQIDSLNHAQGVVQQGLQTVTNMFGPQAQQTADQNSINQAQGLVNNAFQGIQTVGNAVDQDQASANQRLAQVTGGMGQDPLSRGLSQVGPAMNWAQNNVLNQVPIPGAPVIQGINSLSNQLGGPQVLPTPNVGGVMQAANLPAEQLPNIPGFSSQPQIAQQFERGAVGAAPYVLGGPESALGKVASIGLGGLGSVADQNLGTQLGPLGLGQLLGMGLPGLLDRGPRPETPAAQPEPVQAPNTTMAPVSTSTTSSYREPAQTPAFYHETSPENARSILTEGRVSNDLSGRGVYVSDSPDLALGQSGKGAMVVLDPAKTEVQAVRPLGQSPEMAQQLGTNYITNRTTSGAVREVRFSADAIQSDPTVRGMVAYAQRGQVTPLTRGFDFQMNPDGSASWTRKGETTTTAPPSTTTTSIGYPAGNQPTPTTTIPNTLPPLAEGDVRAYRGNRGEIQPASNRSDAGRWFSPDQSIAEGYKSRDYSPGQPNLYYTDVPAEVARGAAEESRFAGTHPDHWVLPAEYANQARNYETQQGLTSTTGPTSTTTTSGVYPEPNQYVSPEHQRGYEQGLMDTTQLAPHEFRPTRGPDDTDFNQGYKEARANLPPGSLVNQPYMPPPEAPTGPAGFRPPEQGLIAEGTDGTIHNITGFLGARGDGEQFFQTEDGVVPLSQLTNLSAADRAELGQMRTAAGGMPPNTPNAAPPNGPNAPGAAAFQQSPAGQQFAGQGAAGMNVTQPGVSSSNAAPSTTYGGGAGGITGQAPPAGREPPSGGGRGGAAGRRDRGGPPISKNFGVLDYLNIPRTLMAGGDASMSLRQSIVMAFAHPQRWLQSLDAGAQAFTSDIAAKDFADQVAADPLRSSVLKNVYQAPTGRGEGTLTTREEQYASPATIPLVSKIPVVGGPISEYYRATERGTLTQLNQVRWDVSKDFAQKLMNSRGETPETVSPYTQRMVDKYVSAVNEATGRGTLGSAAVEKAVLPLSQVFFSWRNAVAKPEYVAQIFSEPFTPAWNAIVKDQAAFLVGGATTLGLLNLAAKQAGVPIQIGLDPRSADFGKAVIGNAHIDIWGGFQQPARAAWQAVMAAEGKPNAVTQGGREYQKSLGDIGITYLGNKLSPQAALAGQMALMQYGDRLPPGTLDALHEAFPTNRQPSLDLRTASQFLTPLWIQDMASAIKNDGVGTGIAAGAASFMGVGVQDYKPSASAQVANAGTQALSEPATLAKAFPDAPIMQQILKGQNYNDLLPTEKTAIKSVLDPAIVQQLDQQNRQQNPVLARHGDAVDYLTQKKNAAENELLDRYNSGTMDGAHVTNLMKAVQADYYNTKAKVDADPAYKAEIAKIPAASTNAQSALDGYYQVEGKAGRAQYIQWLADRDPALAARIATAVQPKNQSKLELMYANGELR